MQCLNAFLYFLYPSQGNADPSLLGWTCFFEQFFQIFLNHFGCLEGTVPEFPIKCIHIITTFFQF
jgi:hypothetical protein